MQKTITIYILFISLLLFQSSCRTIAPNKMSYFKLKNTSYQSWYISAENKGTDVTIIVSNVKVGVRFKSIVFRGIEVPVSEQISGNKIVLKASFNPGIATLHSNYQINRNANQLKYQIGSQHKSMLLNNIKRKKNKFYRLSH